MALTALRGALGFLTRLSVGRSGDDWDAFRRTPAAFPLAGYPVGALAALPLALGLAGVPAATVGAVALGWLYALTGINHLDGVADLGDAAVVHGDGADRIEALKDAAVGVGGVAAVVGVGVGVAAGFVGLVRIPLSAALATVVAAEVGSKFVMAAVACLGTARHEGLGSAFTSASTPRSVVIPALVAAPAAALPAPAPVAAAALCGAVAGGGLLARRADRLLGGVSGDVFGAASELGRVVGLHAGVIAWTLS